LNEDLAKIIGIICSQSFYISSATTFAATVRDQISVTPLAAVEVRGEKMQGIDGRVIGCEGAPAVKSGGARHHNAR
jgi:hypothetical protein